MTQFITISLINAALVLFAIFLHYEVLYHLARQLADRLHLPRRFRVLLSVCVIFMTHVVEIWVFALGYYYTLNMPGMGKLIGENLAHGGLMDCAYLSFVTFTTVGYGDLVVHGYARYLTGLEALTGLVLVTWSASFLFIEMQRYWPGSKSNPN
jgi:Ion channel